MTINPLISAADLAIALASASPPRLLDARAQLGLPFWGLTQYANGHIHDAEHLNLEFELSDLSKSITHGRHPLPNCSAFAILLARLGLAVHDVIVVYDQDSSAYAARLWWLLRAAGFTKVWVLDGGYAAWQSYGGKASLVRSAYPALTPNTLSFVAMPQRGFAELMDNIQTKKLALLDARAAIRFEGKEEPIDPVAGHVPGAQNRPFTCNLENGKFKSAALLRHEFQQQLGTQDAASMTHMCGSGVTACHNLLAMHIAGLPGAALFAPSWSGWICDSNRPVARVSAC